MWGRFFGLAVGLVLLGEGYLLWRPETLGGGQTPDLGPFTQYRLLVSLLAAAVGAAVIMASMLRETAPRAKTAETASGGGINWAEAAAAEAQAPSLQPVVAAHDAPEELEPFPRSPAEVAALEPSLAPPSEPILAEISAHAHTPIPLAPAEPPSERGAFLELTDHGHRMRAAGRLDDALEPYGEALAIARRRQGAAPGDTGAKRDLATALTNIADIHDHDGRIDQAISMHEESLVLRRGLAAAEPDDLGAQRGLSLGLERLADARDARGHRSRARDLFRERLVLAERLAALAPSDAALAQDLANTRERLRELDEALKL